MDHQGIPLNEWGDEEQAATEQTCLICSCTDSKACDGGCSWVLPGICSKCITHEVPECIDLLIGVIFGLTVTTSAQREALIKVARKIEDALRQ